MWNLKQSADSSMPCRSVPPKPRVYVVTTSWHVLASPWLRYLFTHIGISATGFARLAFRASVPLFWCVVCGMGPRINTMRPRQNGRHSADDIFKSIFLKENVWISTYISLKFIPKGPNRQFISFGLDNCLMPNKRQAIIWTNGGLVYWRIYASFGLN